YHVRELVERDAAQLLERVADVGRQRRRGRWFAHASYVTRAAFDSRRRHSRFPRGARHTARSGRSALVTRAAETTSSCRRTTESRSASTDTCDAPIGRGREALPWSRARHRIPSNAAP